jgi:hypothetical protein
MVDFYLNGVDAYAMRCALLHEGSDFIYKQRAAKDVSVIRFFAPDNGYQHQNLRTDGRLDLDVKTFCGDVLSGYSAWNTYVATNQDVSDRRRQLSKILDAVVGF